MTNEASKKHHVVVVGGGFGGLYAVKILAGAPVDITLIDKRNFHLFQPLLYQVATGGLSPGDIISPLRAIFKRRKNVKVAMDEVTDIDTARKNVITRRGKYPYDTLILATGVASSYFGHDDWREKAPDLKTIEDALAIRQRILTAFEEAENETDPEKRKAWLSFVIVGGGPTGVELAGALAELCRQTLKNEFRSIDTATSRIFLVEASPRLLQSYPSSLSYKAARALGKMGVKILEDTFVTGIDGNGVTIKQGDSEKKLSARTVLWAAGIKATPLARLLAEKTGVKTDRLGRLTVRSDLSLEGESDIFIIGDLALAKDKNGEPLPGVAPVAMQQGKYVARRIMRKIKGNEQVKPFRYRDRGSLAVIGRNSAVVWFGKIRLAGFTAWLVWIFVHIAYLIEYDNKLIVLIQWAWNFFTRKKGARLITRNH